MSLRSSKVTKLLSRICCSVWLMSYFYSKTLFHILESYQSIWDKCLKWNIAFHTALLQIDHFIIELTLDVASAQICFEVRSTRFSAVSVAHLTVHFSSILWYISRLHSNHECNVYCISQLLGHFGRCRHSDLGFEVSDYATWWMRC